MQDYFRAIYDNVVEIKSRIKCNSWFNVGSRIIENKLGDVFLLFLAPVGHYPNPFPNPAAGQI